jgi:hypothetical protein
MLLIFSGATFGQAFYSVKQDYLRSRTEEDDLLGKFNNTYPDTSVSDLHQFFPRNYLGNYGLASPTYILDHKAEDLGFKLYPSPMENDMFLEKNVAYYKTKGPYACLNGIGGSKQLQILKMMFTHTYKNVNITLKFNRYTSKGFYSKQQTYTNNFYLSSNYATKKNRFGYYFYYLNNGNKSQENGGIVGDTLSEYALTQPKEVLSVHMAAAVRDNKEHKLMFNPWFKVFGAADSLNRLNAYIQIKSRFSLNSWMHKDPYSGRENNYLLFYKDTTSTKDSSGLLKFTNDLYFSLVKGKDKNGISCGYRNEIDRLYQGYDSIFMNHMALADMYFEKETGTKDSLGKRAFLLSNSAQAQYILSGPNSTNYLFEDKMRLRVQKTGTEIYLILSAISRNADHIYNNWHSNHFDWSNNGFRNVETKEVKIGVDHKKKFGLSVFAQDVFNLLYFDNIAYPRQYNNSIQNLGVRAYFDVVLLKHLGIAAENIFQQTSHPAYLSIPPNITTVKLYFAANMFRKNLQLNFGVQGQMYQSFYTYSYMPATQIFYLQSSKQSSNYPYVDVYLNARIRPVSFFVKLENALQNYVGRDYSLVKGYFQPDRCVRFGISWMFFD